ncbi:MAG: hypothetical protein JWN59_1428 [Sphingomonas bacterium]|nr:hypothetical protein [Sphingomonas bacterium]
MPPVDSSAILTIDHDAATARLVIRFVSGRRYAYAGVPAEVYAAMLAAPSMGVFFNAHIRGVYPFTAVD